jgi:dihydroorotase
MLYARNGRKDDLVIRGARVLDPAEGIDAVLDVRVDKGVIAQIGESVDANGHRVIEGAGLVLAPAFVDPHVHLRVPGGEDEETIASGTEAAAAGGYSATRVEEDRRGGPNPLAPFPAREGGTLKWQVDWRLSVRSPSGRGRG